MKETPILYNGQMVRAILDDLKGQTRRLVKGVPADCDIITCSTLREEADGLWCDFGNSDQRDGAGVYETIFSARCPYGQPGDRLWVRERFRMEQGSPCYYTACHCGLEGNPGEKGWKPSIHMPRWASRITLEITDIRVQRVQEISEEDCWAEGISEADARGWLNKFSPLEPRPADYPAVKRAFADLWNSIYGNWNESPWVWAISFKRIEQ